MKTTFDQNSARDYEFTNGHPPRGFGHWSFGLGRDGAWTRVRFTGKYTDARKQAMAEARSLGCTDVVLDS